MELAPKEDRVYPKGDRKQFKGDSYVNLKAISIFGRICSKWILKGFLLQNGRQLQMLVEIKENPFIQIEGNFHMKLQCFREKGGFIDQKGRRSIAGLGSVTPRPIHSPRTFAVDPPNNKRECTG